MSLTETNFVIVNYLSIPAEKRSMLYKGNKHKIKSVFPLLKSHLQKDKCSSNKMKIPLRKQHVVTNDKRNQYTEFSQVNEIG